MEERHTGAGGGATPAVVIHSGTVGRPLSPESDCPRWHPDVGARDLAFFLALQWDAEGRREVEQPLLRHYLHHPLARGVTDYSFEELLLDYRRGAVRNPTFPIILWARRLAREAWVKRLESAVTAYRDLGGGDLL